LYVSKPELPDGMFSNQKSKFGLIIEGLGVKKVGISYLLSFGIYYGHLVYFIAIW
jgi:hypothetical protein